MRTAVWILCLLGACDSSLGKRLRDYRGDRVVSNAIAPPAGARWTRAEVHTSVYGTQGNDQLLDRTWSVSSALVVDYPEGIARQVFVDLREGGLTATEDRMAELAAATYQIELTANGTRVRWTRGTDVDSIPLPTR